MAASGSEYVHFHVEEADGRYVGVLGLGDLGLVGIVFYGPDYPRGAVVASQPYPCESTAFIWSSSSERIGFRLYIGRYSEGETFKHNTNTQSFSFKKRLPSSDCV